MRQTYRCVDCNTSTGRRIVCDACIVRLGFSHVVVESTVAPIVVTPIDPSKPWPTEPSGYLGDLCSFVARVGDPSERCACALIAGHELPHMCTHGVPLRDGEG